MKRKKRFPKKELNSFFKLNKEWNHDTWLALLATLEEQGFEEWTSNQDGQDQIGAYLEEKKAA